MVWLSVSASPTCAARLTSRPSIRPAFDPAGSVTVKRSSCDPSAADTPKVLGSRSMAAEKFVPQPDDTAVNFSAHQLAWGQRPAARRRGCSFAPVDVKLAPIKRIGQIVEGHRDAGENTFVKPPASHRPAE